VSQYTRLVLTNAVYFNGSWATAFEPSDTHDGDFHQLDGSTKQVPLMHKTIGTRLGHGTGFTTVEVPYSNRDLTLTLIVPDPGKFAAVESQLSAAFLDAAVAAEAPAQVQLGLPKFAMKTSAHLTGPLTVLGMDQALGDGADFSGIDGQQDLAISEVVHEATVTVDEAGTQAAAATAVVVGTTSVAPQPVPLTVDRPFILVLRDVPTGAVLFVGRVSQL
jgi:serpin B